MGDALVGVDDRAAKVVGGVRLVLPTMPMVRLVDLTPVEHGVAHALVEALHVDLPADAVLQPLLRADEHLLESAQILLDGQVPALRRRPGIALDLHLVRIGIVRICLPLSDHLLHVLLQHADVVARVRRGLMLDLQQLEVFDDARLVLHLLLGRICVVESEQHLPAIYLGISGIQQRGLGVTDVQISGRLRRESRDDLAMHCIYEHALEVGNILGTFFLGSLGLRPSPQRIQLLQALNMLPPARNMRLRGACWHALPQGDVLLGRR
mmetsp:Transcript_45801/g.132141  ORF Transcript_45801/g.132141 Transcript_45801/m.132141 type:complete len:266 (-) Transcript_45801:124-921(-)